jgi:FAD/FMN-containing dehydrogenase
MADKWQIFGENAEKLRAIKERVDPNNKLRGAYTI